VSFFVSQFLPKPGGSFVVGFGLPPFNPGLSMLPIGGTPLFFFLLAVGEGAPKNFLHKLPQFAIPLLHISLWWRLTPSRAPVRRSQQTFPLFCPFFTHLRPFCHTVVRPPICVLRAYCASQRPADPMHDGLCFLLFWVFH